MEEFNKNVAILKSLDLTFNSERVNEDSFMFEIINKSKQTLIRDSGKCSVGWLNKNIELIIKLEDNESNKILFKAPGCEEIDLSNSSEFKYKRFIVFAWDSHESCGGMNDYQFCGDTINDVLEWVSKSKHSDNLNIAEKFENYQIFDRIEGKEIKFDVNIGFAKEYDWNLKEEISEDYKSDLENNPYFKAATEAMERVQKQMSENQPKPIKKTDT